MNKIIHKLLSVLKEHVSQNNKDIQLNQEEIDKLLSETPSKTSKINLDARYSTNRELLNENADFVKMQLELAEFLEKYKLLFPSIPDETNVQDPKENDTRKLFTQTINGKLKFDRAHPQYHNPKFFQELLKYYEIHEDYEMCDKLLKQRSM
jgi:hypothetical protein